MATQNKIILIIFTIALVINLQFTGSLTSNMDDGFSIEQLAENIFVPSAFAYEIYNACFTTPDQQCIGFWMPQGYLMLVCSAGYPGYNCW
jgi:hypothetical protein